MVVVRLFAAIVILLGSLSTLQASAKDCSTDGAGSSASQATSKSNPTSRKRSKVQRDSEDPCQGGNSQANSNSSGETVGWDPVTDRPIAHEIVSWFVFGLLISAPVFFVVRRLKTRKNESEPVRKVLE